MRLEAENWWKQAKADLKTAENLAADASTISPAYIFSRYPDAGTEIPSLFYDEQKAKEHLHKAKIIFQWIEKKIKL